MSAKDLIDSFMKVAKNLIMMDDEEEDFLLLSSGFQTFAPGMSLTWFASPQAFLAAQNWRHQPIHLLILDLYLVAANFIEKVSTTAQMQHVVARMSTQLA